MKTIITILWADNEKPISSLCPGHVFNMQTKSLELRAPCWHLTSNLAEIFTILVLRCAQARLESFVSLCSGRCILTRRNPKMYYITPGRDSLVRKLWQLTNKLRNFAFLRHWLNTSNNCHLTFDFSLSDLCQVDKLRRRWAIIYQHLWSYKTELTGIEMHRPPPYWWTEKTRNNQAPASAHLLDPVAIFTVTERWDRYNDSTSNDLSNQARNRHVHRLALCDRDQCWILPHWTSSKRKRKPRSLYLPIQEFGNLCMKGFRTPVLEDMVQQFGQQYYPSQLHCSSSVMISERWNV